MTGKIVEPAAGLEALIENIVDKILRQRRMRPTPEQKGMSRKQFGVSVGIGLSTVDKEIDEGRLEAIKAGGGKRVIITTAARERWLASQPRIKPRRPRDDGAAHANV